MENINDKMENTFDIIELIEKNPITKLGCTYNNRFLEKIESTFSQSQQQLFLGSFYCYLNYNPDTEYVVNLDNVWKWCGFSRKDLAKRLLEKKFNKDIDYKILLYEQEFFLQTAENPLGGGRPSEQILMTINTFKKFCMKARTDKADEIHDYYIKLEKILHETLEEESEFLRIKLTNQEKLLKTQEEELNKLKKIKNCIYIGHTNVYKNMTKIGITEDLTKRLENHKSSNPHFEYLYTYNSENAVLIENMVKLLLKNRKSCKAEWFSVSSEHMKRIVEFVIVQYDTYKISESVENIIKFISKHNEIIDKIEIDREQYFAHKYYERYINECVINTNDNTKTPLYMIVSDFEDWFGKNNIEHINSIYNNTDNNKIKLDFKTELRKKIEDIFGKKSEKLNVSDVRRNVRTSKAIGWIGLDIKSIYDNAVFFSYDVYDKFCTEKLQITGDEKDKVVGNFLMGNFLKWCTENGIDSKLKDSIYQNNKFGNFFQDEFISRIENITEVKYSKNKTFRGVFGFFYCLRYDNIINRGNNTSVYRQSIDNLEDIKKYDKLSDCSEEMRIGKNVLALHLKNHSVYERENYVYSYKILKKYNKNDYVNKNVRKIYKQNKNNLTVIKEYDSLTNCAEDIQIHVNTLCKQLKNYPYYENGDFIYSYTIIQEYKERENHPNAKIIYGYKENEPTYIKKFKSISDCAKYINIHSSTLSKHLKQKGEYKDNIYTFSFDKKYN